MATDGFIFYASFFEAISELEEADQLAVYNAVCQYGLFGIEPECSGTVKAMFRLIKPQIDANTKRREAGKKGGEVKQSEANPKQTEASAKQSEASAKQTEANVKQSEASLKQTEAKVKEKVKDKEKVKEESQREKENLKGNVNVLKDISSEPSVEAFEPEADVEAIPLNDGSEWRPSVDEYHEYKRLYPSVDIDQAFRSMRGWSKSNPAKRKTKTGVRRFVTTWLEKEQDRGGRASPVKSTPSDFFIRVANGGEI